MRMFASVNRPFVKQRSPLWLALFAMLLISVGPLATQLSQQAEPAQAAWLNEMACGEHGAYQHAHHNHAELWAKCGYCTLLLNSPVTVRATVQLSLPARFYVLQRAPFVLGERSAAVFPGARSRAPPQYS